MNSDNSTAEKKTHFLLIHVLFILLPLSLLPAVAAVCFAAIQGLPLPVLLLFLIIQLAVLSLAVLAFFSYRKSERFLHLYREGNGEKLLQMICLPYSPAVKQILSDLQKNSSEDVLWEENKRQSQYLALQNQINPHFLYNTLEAIRSEALIGGLQTVADMSETLANYFRYTISNMSELVTLADEIQNIRDYFMIQQFRFGDRIKLNIKIPLDGELRFYRMPKLILQPIVENAVIHGLESELNGGTITVTAKITDENFYIYIEDDGAGMPHEKLVEINKNLSMHLHIFEKTKKHGGIAIYNVNERLQLLFGAKYGLTYYSMPQIGTTVEIILPKVSETKLPGTAL